MSETDISRSIREALEECGFWVERTNSGKVPTRNGWFTGLSDGTPDTLLVAPAYGWLETKTDEGKLRPAQVEWHERARRRGIRVAVVRTVGAAVSVAMKWRSEGRTF